MARDSVVAEQVWFPRFRQTQTVVPKGIGGKGVSCWPGVVLAEELLLWLLLQKSWAGQRDLTAGKSGMEGPGEGLQGWGCGSVGMRGGGQTGEALRILAEGCPCCPCHEQG